MKDEDIIKLQREAVAAGCNPAKPDEVDEYVARKIAEAAAAPKTTKKKASKKKASKK